MTPLGGSNPTLAKLNDPRERFLARLLEGVLSQGSRTASDFLECFPAPELIDALESEPEARVRLLMGAAGIPKKIAMRRSSLAAHEDLEIALDEGLTDAASIVALVPLDVLVRVLDAAKLWSYAVDGDWLTRAEHDPRARDAAADRVVFVVRMALEEDLLTIKDVGQGLTLEQIAEHMPVEALRKAFAYSLQTARDVSYLDEDRLLEQVDFMALLAQAPPEQVWRDVVLERIAGPLGLLEETAGGALPASRGQQPVQAHARPAPATPAPQPATSTPQLLRPPPQSPAEAAPRARAPSLSDEISIDISDEEIELESETELELTEPVGQALRARPQRAPSLDRSGPRAADTARRRPVTDKLRKLGRLPNNHEYLSLAILRSITTMYEELGNHRGKTARAECIRACFDNDSHLRTAMIALIELLDPGMARLVADGSSDSLVDALLVQERTIWQRARTKRASVPPPPSEPIASGSRRLGSARVSAPPALPLTRITKSGWRH